MAPRRPPKPRQTTPRQIAVALPYDQDKDAAPTVVAKGQGLIAEKILDLARRNNIPVSENPDLAHLLAQLDLGELIPAELYPAVAEVLAYVYRQNRARPGAN